MKKLILIFLFLPCLLQAQTSIRGEIRVRPELRHGYATLPAAASEPAEITSQRTRLKLNYTKENLSFGLAVQDIRIWGEEEQVKNKPSMALHEAWGEIGFAGYFAVRAGRQELAYDDHRILGNADWIQQARSHDAGILKFRHEDWKADLGVAYNQKGDLNFNQPYTTGNYRSMAYLWFSKKLLPGLDLSAITVSDALQESDTVTALRWRHTFGGNLLWSGENLRAGASYYRQSGVEALSQKDISAFLAAAYIGWQFDSLSLRAGIDYLSGTNSSEKEKYMCFNTLYATNHKFYGLMDLYTAIPRDTKNAGLQDIYASLSYNFSSAFGIKLDAHQFSLAASLADPANSTAVLGRNLGAELDLSAVYRISTDVTLQAGLSQYYATATTQAVKGGSKDAAAYWGWMMLSFTPGLFK